jgi:hypothetical protein
MVGLLVLPPRANLVLTIGLCLLGLAYSAAMFWLGQVWLSPLTTVLGLKIVALVWGWGQLGRVNDLLSRELARVRGIVRSRKAAPADFETDVVARQASSLGEAITRWTTCAASRPTPCSACPTPPWSPTRAAG